ncbi:hypothetical protein H2198_007309 [Neophaeococcomyces mojaviensis]|uniref:Uncharacterized protein n=1 Tax=Neophaeococcomyces mojaviensis TaxID=3383035 RepID=A0ACC3A0E8_9EURO|nr:hypothetical protein H2198_007309 [Knufia sp. JES_112]
MSAEARPISASEFAQTIEDLPVENLYSKAFEINNSIAHLRHSNKSLQEYSDSIRNDTTLDPNTRADGDKDCLDAIKENEVVIERQLERIGLLKAEVERRGGKWHEADPNSKQETPNGNDEASTEIGQASSSTTAGSAQTPARWTDDELRRQLEARMAEGTDEDEGMHL